LIGVGPRVKKALSALIWGVEPSALLGVLCILHIDSIFKRFCNINASSILPSSRFTPDDDDDDDVYLKKIITRVSQNLILHKNADLSKA
jgi:hypothetical protein